MNALLKLVTSNSTPFTRESKVVKNDNVIALGMFRINPSNTSMVDNVMPNKCVKESVRTKSITTLQHHVISHENVNSNSNDISSTRVESTAKTRRPHQRMIGSPLCLRVVLRTVRFRNDHVAAILGYGDLKWENILITKFYFVEGLGHNLFLVGQFCDSDLEYLKNEHYALWEVIEFGDSYQAPLKQLGTGSASESSTKKKERIVAITTKDMQKRRNDVKGVILKTFCGNKATKKTKKNQLKQQYGNFKAECSETLEQTFNRLQAIVSHLEFMDVEIEQDYLNQKFLTNLAPEWLMYTIVWRNRANTSSGKGKVHTACVPTASTQVSTASADVTAASISHDTVCAYIASQSNGSQIKYEDITQIDEDDIEEMYINQSRSTSIATRWVISLGSVEHLGSKTGVEEKVTNKSYMANEEENHALVADKEALTEFSLTAKSSSSSENEVSDDSFCSKSCRKNTDSLNTKITKLNEALSDMLFPPPAQVYSPPKKDMSWTGLPEFADATITDYSRPSPSIESNTSDLQNDNSSIFEHGESSNSIMSKPMIKFVKAADSPIVIKTNKVETARKPPVRYAKITPIAVNRINMNAAQPKRTYFSKTTHSYVRRPFQRKSTVRTQFQVPRVSTVNTKFPTVDSKFYTDKSTSTAGLGNKGKAVKASTCYIWRPKQNSTEKGGGKIISKGIIKTGQLEFENVYFVKDLKYNLFSMSQICDIKNSVLFTDSECIVLGKDFKLKDVTNVFLRTPRQHNMYSIDLNNIIPHKNLTCLVAKASADESMMCHRRLGHLNFKIMNKLVRHNLVKGLPSKCFENDHTYVACLKEKQHKASCKTKLVKSVSKPFHTLHIDLFGPTSVSSLNHKWYCLVVTDDFSRCDNRGEFKNKEMHEFCTRKGIKREFNNARTPQQNRVAEKRNRTLIKAARTMLADVKLPVTFWTEAVNTACYVQNKGLVNKSQNKTPYELFNSRTPAIRFLKLFGCHVMILNTLEHLGKCDAKGDEGYFIGYSMSSKAFRVFNKRNKKVEENLDVDFLENKLIEKGAGPNWLFDIDTLTNSMNYVPVVVAGTSSTNISGTKDATSQCVKKDVSSLRYIALPNWFHEAHMESSNNDAHDACNADAPESSGIFNPTATSKSPLAEQMESLTEEPKKLFDGLKDPSWVEAMQEELLQFKIQNVWILVYCPKGEEGIDYEEFFAPVVRIEAIRLFLAYDLFMGFTVYQMDVKSAFLYDRVYKVEKAMYRLHQAHRAWYGTLSKYLLANDFQKGTINQTLFIRKHIVDLLLVQVYVDDIIFGSSNPQLYREFEALMHEKFLMSAMGELNFFLGLQVLQKKDGIFLSQDKYVGDILKKFGYSDVRSANTPMDKENPSRKDGTGKDVELHLYRSMIGSFMYLTASRPDIMFVVCACARHQVTPKECHLHTVKRIFRYLKGHPKLGVWYPKESPFYLVACSDSNYGGTTQDRKSTTGGC
nr:retrovirus-related Pol polyprotein from transposon TNT 1-94 [Tanacetum cinerariifolium]